MKQVWLLYTNSNNKGADQTLQMYRLGWTFVIHMQQSDFLRLRPICEHRIDNPTENKSVCKNAHYSAVDVLKLLHNSSFFNTYQYYFWIVFLLEQGSQLLKKSFYVYVHICSFVYELSDHHVRLLLCWGLKTQSVNQEPEAYSKCSKLSNTATACQKA